ncbi:heterokaryon incompatibility protein-domain-containing protein [Fusarium venenatum]|uniref:heterokaryon incompatibility protein-domain-containing protein n=1 Tax=Fusarium venenatum TaxID=56646 RepID=UPI001DBBAAE5|nr:heterokaryon incompatibility protein-domain-containing protein [Fusarium venenatum]
MDSKICNPYAGRILDKDDFFRLIQLEQGRDDAQLIISLRSTTLDDAPPYEAVSYVWGDANALVPVQIMDDKAQTFHVAIPVNCHAALKRLRRFDSPRTLWIDSICINQALSAEKAHQLNLMSFIYQKARQVVVYLGEGTHDTDVAMRCILELDQPSDYGTRSEVVEKPSPTLDEREAVRVLFDRPWFYRVWILQEITFAHRAIVVCGAHEVEWESFRKFYHWNVSNRWMNHLPYSLDYSVSPTLRGGYFLPYGERLMKMLIDTRLCGATDPRDKLYAILPLLDRDQEEMRSKVEYHKEIWKDEDEDEDPDHWNTLEHSLRIQVNYDHTVKQVYTDLAMLLLQSNGLDVLRQVIKDSAVHGLPSWVPDWSTGSPYWTAFNKPRERKNAFFAGFPERPTRYIWGWKSRYPHLIDTWTSSIYTSTENETSTQLHFRAVRVGTITKLGEVCDITKNHFPIGQWASLVPQEFYHKKRNIPEDLPYEETSKYRNGPMGLSPFIQTLTLGDVVYPEAAEDAVAYIRQYNGEVLDNGGVKFFGVVSEDTQQNIPLAEVFMGAGSYERQAQRILKGCDGKRFFVADNGDIGLAPDRARTGDVVFCVQGASVPFILRSLPTTEIYNNDKGEIPSSSPHQVSVDKLFCLVGEAYSLGIMEGEMWDDVDNGRAKVEEIVLR